MIYRLRIVNGGEEVIILFIYEVCDFCKGVFFVDFLVILYFFGDLKFFIDLFVL